MKRLFLFAVLSVGIISGVVFSPEIWAIVEPHITINMDPGQTTKPFVINDDSGTEVFSVDVDGTITPTPSGGVTEGTEVTVLDHSSFTGTSSTIPNGNMVGAEFTMPTVANAYLISAIEVRTGTTISTSTTICAVVVRATGDGDSFPIATAGDWLPLHIVATARNGVITSTGANDIATSTIYKMSTTSSIISGGEKLAVLFASCNNTSTQFDGATRTEIWTGASNNIIGQDADGLGSQSRLQFQATTNNYYLKVYAQPI